jgi:hypothetical protein
MLNRMVQRTGASPSVVRRLAAVPAPLIILIAVAAAVLVNLAVYAGGVLLGGGFVFTTPNGPARVDAATVIGFSALPLAVGLICTAVLARWWRRVFGVAMVVATVLAVGTIAVMTVPSDHDAVAKVTLAVCHLTLVPITLVAVSALRERTRQLRAGEAPARPAPLSRQG